MLEKIGVALDLLMVLTPAGVAKLVGKSEDIAPLILSSLQNC